MGADLDGCSALDAVTPTLPIELAAGSPLIAAERWSTPVEKDESAGGSSGLARAVPAVCG